MTLLSVPSWQAKFLYWKLWEIKNKYLAYFTQKSKSLPTKKQRITCSVQVSHDGYSSFIPSSKARRSLIQGPSGAYFCNQFSIRSFLSSRVNSLFPGHSVSPSKWKPYSYSNSSHNSQHHNPKRDETCTVCAICEWSECRKPIYLLVKGRQTEPWTGQEANF